MTCSRCGDTGVEVWAGRILPRDTLYLDGPCLRCRWRDFWPAFNAVGTAQFLTITYRSSK